MPEPRKKSAIRQRLERWRADRRSDKQSSKLGLILFVLIIIGLGIFLFLKFRGDNNNPGDQQTSAAVSDGQLDINSATAAQLEALPDIGPETAKDIVAGRPCSRPEDLLKIKGIGLKTVDAIRDKVKFPKP